MWRKHSRVNFDLLRGRTSVQEAIRTGNIRRAENVSGTCSQILARRRAVNVSPAAVDTHLLTLHSLMLLEKQIYYFNKIKIKLYAMPFALRAIYICTKCLYDSCVSAKFFISSLFDYTYSRNPKKQFFISCVSMKFHDVMMRVCHSRMCQHGLTYCRQARFALLRGCDDCLRAHIVRSLVINYR